MLLLVKRWRRGNANPADLRGSAEGSSASSRSINTTMMPCRDCEMEPFCSLEPQAVGSIDTVKKRIRINY